MNTFTEKDKELILEALNFLLKNQQNALQAAGTFIPVALKVQEINTSVSESGSGTEV